MHSNRLRKAICATLVALACSGAGLSSARAQIASEHPRHCVLDVGPTQVMFSAFQEGKTDEIFCRHVPELGRTLLIVDARQVELRDMDIEIRVLRDIGQKDWRDELDKTTVAILPASKYLAKNGTMTLTHDFTQDGDYIAVIRAVGDKKEYVGQYFFSVGETLTWYAALASAALVAVIAGVATWRSRMKARLAAVVGQFEIIRMTPLDRAAHHH